MRRAIEVGDTYTHWSKDSQVNGYEDLMWNIYVEQDIPLKHQSDIWRNTVKSIWVCSNIVEQTTFGHDYQLPLLRIIPAESVNDSHAVHTFIVPHYKKVKYPRIETIKIWLLEQVSNIRSYAPNKVFTYDTHERSEFIPLIIIGEIIVQLDFVKNAE